MQFSREWFKKFDPKSPQKHMQASHKIYSLLFSTIGQKVKTDRKKIRRKWLPVTLEEIMEKKHEQYWLFKQPSAGKAHRLIIDGWWELGTDYSDFLFAKWTHASMFKIDQLFFPWGKSSFVSSAIAKR